VKRPSPTRHHIDRDQIARTPDPSEKRYRHVLAQAYAANAVCSGHQIRRIVLAAADLPLLRCQGEWEESIPSAFIGDCQETIGWADHLVIIYPLWLGSMPALLKAFFEQTFRPGFAIALSRFRELDPEG
jgi:putative NADPH-quinone reductase